MREQLNHIFDSTSLLLPELVLTCTLIVTIVLGLVLTKHKSVILKFFTLLSFVFTLLLVIQNTPLNPIRLFENMMLLDSFSSFFKILFLFGGILAVLISPSRKEHSASEYYMLLQAIVLGSSLLAMSINFILVIISLELISLSSYLLVGFGFDKKSAEGSLKYFLFGSVATACSIYGLSILFGFSGSLDFSSDLFLKSLLNNSSPLLLISGLLVLAGFFFKISAAPFHFWTPDVYESAPTPIVAFLSVVPKLAGLVILTRFTVAIHLFGQSGFNWQLILAIIAMLSILIGNLSALGQDNPKRMMAYSSVAHAGFLMIGLVLFGMEGIRFMMFYAFIFLIMNFLVFHVLAQFEDQMDLNTIPSFAGIGRIAILPSIVLLVGLVSLTGLPPTAGFSAKLFVFSALWGAYEQGGNSALLILLVVGLINTVISLFFYFKIPYYQFLKENNPIIPSKNFGLWGNLLSLILVSVLIYLFINPNELMGWINKINFVL